MDNFCCIILLGLGIARVSFYFYLGIPIKSFIAWHINTNKTAFWQINNIIIIYALLIIVSYFPIFRRLLSYALELNLRFKNVSNFNFICNLIMHQYKTFLFHPCVFLFYTLNSYT